MEEFKEVKMDTNLLSEGAKKLPTMKSLGGSDAVKKAEKPVKKAEEKAAEVIDFSKVQIEHRAII